MDRVRVVIADDEELSRRRIARLLQAHADFETVEVCENGREVVHAVQRLNPNLLILDVRMPEFDGFEVLRHLDPNRRPFVIFLTAFDDFAVKAFDVSAIDYVMKPVDCERFAVALDRAREAVRRDRERQVTSQFLEFVAQSGRSERYVSRMTAKRGARTVVFRVDQIDWIESAENYVRVHLGRESLLVRITLTAIEKRLDPARFARIQRTAIVNLDAILEIVCQAKDDYVVVLRSGERVPLSRLYRSNLEALVGRVI